MSSALFLMLFVGWLQNKPAILLGEIVDIVIGGQKTLNSIIPILLLIGIIILVKEIVNWLRKYIVEKTATSIERDELINVIKRLLEIDISILYKERVGDLNVRIHRSIDGVVRLLKIVFLDFLPMLAIGLVAYYMSISRHWSLGIILAVVILLDTIITFWQIKSQKGIRIELFRAKEKLGGNLTELLNGIDYVRASGAIKDELDKGKKLASFLREKEFKHHKYMMSFDAIKQLIEGIGLVTVVALGSYLAIHGFVSEGDVLTFAVLYSSVTNPLRELHRLIDEGFEASLMIQDLENLYSLKKDIGLDGKNKPSSSKISNPIILSTNLSVSYNNNIHRTALTNINTSININDKIGIVGFSGSGKSTFIKVILGLIPNYGGSLKIFDTEVREICKDYLTRRISYIPQTPFIINGTVAENITYGNSSKEYSKEDLYVCLDKVQLKEKVESFEDGLFYELLEQGRNLSGGEKQRLVLARVFYKQAEILILDEATAALDGVNENLVVESINKLVYDKTAIMITHNPKTLRITNRILVFKDSKLVGDGDYNSLLRDNIVFKDLINSKKDSI
jgi:ATP-binding cassette subfamily B protein